MSRSAGLSTLPRTVALVAFAAAVAGIAAACGSPAGPAGSPAPTPAPSASALATGDVVVTIEVAGAERYRILLTDPADIAIARDLLAGKGGPSIPNGRVIRGDPGVNTGYSWQIDPDAFEWADVTMEVCDGRPSDVEAGRISGDRFCPWSAKVVAIQPAS